MMGFICMAICEDFDAYFLIKGKAINIKEYIALMPVKGHILESVERAVNALKVLW